MGQWQVLWGEGVGSGVSLISQLCVCVFFVLFCFLFLFFSFPFPPFLSPPPLPLKCGVGNLVASYFNSLSIWLMFSIDVAPSLTHTLPLSFPFFKFYFIIIIFFFSSLSSPLFYYYLCISSVMSVLSFYIDYISVSKHCIVYLVLIM